MTALTPRIEVTPDERRTAAALLRSLRERLTSDPQDVPSWHKISDFIATEIADDVLAESTPRRRDVVGYYLAVRASDVHLALWWADYKATTAVAVSS